MLIVSYIAVPRLEVDPVTINMRHFRGQLYGAYLSLHSLMSIFIIRPFLAGTFFVPIIEKLGGAQIDDLFRVLMMVSALDSKLISINRPESDSYFYFVNDEGFFDGHTADKGLIEFRKCSFKGEISLHNNALVLGQNLNSKRISIGQRSKVSSRNIVAHHSGFFFGLPAKECLSG